MANDAKAVATALKNKLAATALGQAVVQGTGEPVFKWPCSWFNSANGCKKGNSCDRAHKVPGRDSAEWGHMSEQFKLRSIIPSKGFLAST